MTHRLVVLATHPIQDQAPLFAHLARQPELALKVVFCHDVRCTAPEVAVGG